jgi:hypothetical protein
MAVQSNGIIFIKLSMEMRAIAIKANSRKSSKNKVLQHNLKGLSASTTDKVSSIVPGTNATHVPIDTTYFDRWSS